MGLQVKIDAFRIMILLAALLAPSHSLPQTQAPAVPTAGVKQENPAPAPDLADIVPQAAKLAGRLAELRKKYSEWSGYLGR